MKFGVDRREATAASADAAAVGVFEIEGKDDRLPPSLALADKASAGLLAAAWKRREVKGKKRELTVLHRPDGRGRVLLVGLGAHADFTTDTVRRAAADVVRGLRGKGARTLAYQLTSFVDGPVTSSLASRALTDGSILGAYEFLRYRTTTEGGIEEAAVYLGEDRVAEERSLTGEVAEQTAIAENVLWTRDIGNLPADTATPERLADEARTLGKALGLKVTVFDEKQLAKMGCGGIVAVGSGSSHPPRLVILDNRAGPDAAARSPSSARGSRSTRAGSRSSPAPACPR